MAMVPNKTTQFSLDHLCWRTSQFENKREKQQQNKPNKTKQNKTKNLPLSDGS